MARVYGSRCDDLDRPHNLEMGGKLAQQSSSESHHPVDSTNGFQPKANRAALRLNAKKLLLTKWTATHPQNKEKHFIVTRLIEPETPDAQIEFVELEATYSRRSTQLPWRELTDQSKWLQGWK